MKRICRKCGETKYLYLFKVNSSLPSGHTYLCKSCANLESLKYKNTNKDYFKKYYKQHRKKINKQIREWLNKHPDVKNCRNRLNTGRIKKSPCTICKNPMSEAHHNDYSKPKDIIWLCKKHHGIIRRMEHFYSPLVYSRRQGVFL